MTVHLATCPFLLPAGVLVLSKSRLGFLSKWESIDSLLRTCSKSQV